MPHPTQANKRRRETYNGKPCPALVLKENDIGLIFSKKAGHRLASVSLKTSINTICGHSICMLELCYTVRQSRRPVSIQLSL